MTRSPRPRLLLCLAILLGCSVVVFAQDKPQAKDATPPAGQVPRCKAGTSGRLEVLSDTEGVNFGAYLQRMLQQVRMNWYAAIPKSAYPPLKQKGTVLLSFKILKNGSVAGLKFVCQSGDVALDRAAYLGVSKSSPLPPLPNEFHGDSLALRVSFVYNPDPTDLGSPSLDTK